MSKFRFSPAPLPFQVVALLSQALLAGGGDLLRGVKCHRYYSTSSLTLTKFSVCSPNICWPGSHTLLQSSNTRFLYCQPVTLREGERKEERRRKKLYFRAQDAKFTQKIHVNCHMNDYLKSYRGGGWKLIKNIYILIVIKTKEKKKQR